VEKHLAALLLVLSALLASLAGPTVVGAELLDRDSLVADVRQLSDMIESIHPDPYSNVSGKVAFHRRFQSVLEAIPAQGMTQADFYKLLRPFVTMIGDAHTWAAGPL